MPDPISTERTSADRALHIVLLTGMSGAGKTFALKTLEDMGFFSIDTFPSSLLDPLLMLLESNPEISKAALAMDIRDPTFVQDAKGVLDRLRARGHTVTVVFLDAKADVLVRRFAETRRPHPIARNIPVQEAVARESEMLAPLRPLSSCVIDTTHFTIHMLRQTLQGLLGSAQGPRFSVVIESFGFKNGAPLDAAYLFDVRFLRNPYFVDTLREKPGTDPEVAQYVMADPDSTKLLDLMVNLLKGALPLIMREGRPVVTIAVGCTGGQHRSVVLAEELRAQLIAAGFDASVVHRDLALPRA